MTTIWALVVIAGGAAVVWAGRWWSHRTDTAELGTVSERWLSEERANERTYSKE